MATDDSVKGTDMPTDDPFESLCYQAVAGNPAALVKYLRTRNVDASEVKKLLANLREIANPEAELAAVSARIATCHIRCSHLDHTGYACGEGPLNPVIMFIGESPGRNEAVTHKPFVGPAGQLLESMLQRIGLHRGLVYLTNTVRCFTTNKDRLTPEVATACRRYLIDEIRIAKPQVVVCLGRFAWESFMQEPHEGRLETLRQQWRNMHLPQSVRMGKLPVAFSYHPSAALRNPEYMRALEKDFDWIGRTLGLVDSAAAAAGAAAGEYDDEDDDFWD
jgi:DNA polymerase